MQWTAVNRLVRNMQISRAETRRVLATGSASHTRTQQNKFKRKYVHYASLLKIDMTHNNEETYKKLKACNAQK